jgi:ribosome-associated protein
MQCIALEFSMSESFAVRGEYIQLDQLLKATGLTGSGGEAHAAVAAGDVKVDGHIESRKRAKLRPGQKVEFAGQTVVLVPAE